MDLVDVGLCAWRRTKPMGHGSLGSLDSTVHHTLPGVSFVEVGGGRLRRGDCPFEDDTGHHGLDNKHPHNRDTNRYHDN